MGSEVESPPASLRDALPSDGSAVAPLLYEASGDFLRHIFDPGGDGRRAVAVVARAFADPEGPFSHRHTRLATQGERIVGAALAYPTRHLLRLEVALLPTLWRCYRPLELVAQIRRGLQARRFLGELPRDLIYLSSLAVAPSRRGAGIGARLLVDLLTRCRAGGRPCLLHVAVDNPGARRLYERHGFRVVGENRVPELEARYRLPGQYVMRRDP